MRDIIAKADLALLIAANANIGFDEAIKRADVLFKSKSEYIDAHMPKKGNTVICKENHPIDNYDAEACKLLQVDHKYIITGESAEGGVFIQDESTGEKIGKPFHKIRFVSIIQ